MTINAPNISLQEVVDWIAGIVIPVLIGLWRKHRSTANKYDAIIQAIITGVENATKDGDPMNIKQAINKAAVQAEVQPALQQKVDAITKTQ